MRTLAGALAALLLACVFPAAAQPACAPAQSLAEVRQVGLQLVEAGAIEEIVILEGDSMARYINALNAKYNSGVPLTLSHILIALRKDGSAILFGFLAGCQSGKAPLSPGVHRELYGVEVQS